MNKNNIDVSQVFLVFMALVGDCTKVALALDLEPEQVEELANKEGWHAKIARVSLMSKGGQTGDWERAQNRAVNWVQAHQLRRSIDRAIVHLSRELDREGGVEKILTHTTKDGSVIYSAKVFSDLAASLEKIHSLSYAALGDSAKERGDRGEHKGADGKEDGQKSALLHAALVVALNSGKLTAQTTSEELVASTVEKVEQLTVSPTIELPDRSTS